MKYIAIEQNNTKQSLLRGKNQYSKNKHNTNNYNSIYIVHTHN